MPSGILSPDNVGTEGAYVTFNDRPLGGHRLLLDKIPPGGRILDAGCSAGYLAERLVDRGSAVVGLELDPEAAERARGVCEQVLVGDVETMELPFEPATFDAVVCGDLIEHLRDPRAFMARVHPLLRSGGRLALTTPNVANLTIRLQLLFGRFEYTQRGILDETHTHLFTRGTLVDAVESAGYRVDEVDFTVPIPKIGERLGMLERVAHAIGGLRPQLFAFQFVLAATRP